MFNFFFLRNQLTPQTSCMFHVATNVEFQVLFCFVFLTFTQQKNERQVVFDHLRSIVSAISVDTDFYLLRYPLGTSWLGVLWRAWL